MLLYVDCTCQKSFYFISCYKQKCKLVPFNLAHPVYMFYPTACYRNVITCFFSRLKIHENSPTTLSVILLRDKPKKKPGKTNFLDRCNHSTVQQRYNDTDANMIGYLSKSRHQHCREQVSLLPGRAAILP